MSWDMELEPWANQKYKDTLERGEEGERKKASTDKQGGKP